LTVVGSVAVLFVRSGSGVVDDTVAVFVIVPRVDEATSTVMSKLALPPLRMVPSEHVNVPAGPSTHESVSDT
jgi:hypothetical protein